MDLWHNGDSRAFQTAIVNGPGCFAKTNSGATAVVLTAREPIFALEVEDAWEVATRVLAARSGARVQLLAAATADLVRPLAQTAH